MVELVPTKVLSPFVIVIYSLEKWFSPSNSIFHSGYLLYTSSDITFAIKILLKHGMAVNEGLINEFIKVLYLCSY